MAGNDGGRANAAALEQGLGQLGQALFGDPAKQVDWKLKKEQTTGLANKNDALGQILHASPDMSFYNVDPTTGAHTMKNPDQIREIAIKMAPLLAVGGFDNPGAVTGAMTAYTGNDDLQRSGLIGRGVQTGTDFAGSANRADAIARRDSDLKLRNAMAVKGAGKGAGGSKEQVSTIVDQIANSYGNLDKEAAVTSPDRGILDNAKAYLSNTPVGQTVGRVFGTANQTERDNIANTRPLLINAIKRATGMSAKQMDSNRELQFFLEAATNPEAGVKSNFKALTNLDKLYGLGLGLHQGDDGGGAGLGAGSDAPVIVTNPETGESLPIDAADLDQAISEGWVQK